MQGHKMKHGLMRDRCMKMRVLASKSVYADAAPMTSTTGLNMAPSEAATGSRSQHHDSRPHKGIALIRETTSTSRPQKGIGLIRETTS